MIHLFDTIELNPRAGGVLDFTRNLKVGLDLVRPGACQSMLARLQAGSVGRLAMRGGRFVAESWAARQLPVGPSQAILPNYYLPVGMPAGLAARSVCVVHDIQHRHFPDYFSPRRLRWLDFCLQRLARSSATAVFISETTRQDFIHHYGEPARHAVILNPIQVDTRADGAIDAQQPAPVADGYLLAAYHAYPHKNFDGTLRLFAAMRRLGYPGALVLTGNSQQAVQQAMADQPALAGHVHHLGFVSRGRLDRLFRDADAFVSMSRFEGFNMPAAESLRHGTPILLSDIPVHRELFGDNGCLIALADVETAASDPVLHAAAQRALASIKPAAGRAAAWRHAVACTPEGAAQRYLALLDSL